MTEPAISKEFLNEVLIKKMPFMFEGRDPAGDCDCVKELIEEYWKIKAKTSGLSASERGKVAAYVEAVQLYAKEAR